MMSHSMVSDQIMERVQNLIHTARRLDRLPEAQAMALRLERVMEILGGRSDQRVGELDRPICIVLLGGTGVGKSELFNALLGEKEVSPTSATIRPRTIQAHVAISPADRQFFPLAGDPDIIFREHHFSGAAHPGVALIDTPDVDSVELVHLERTRRLVEAADIVVHVGSPDKRANFKIHEEIRRWATRKRWFFVLNKMDQISESDRESVCADFLHRIRQMGFDVGQDSFFAVSAVQPGEPPFDAFRATLFSHRATEHIRALRAEDTFNQIRYALTGDTVAAIQRIREQLLEREEELNTRVRAVFAQVINTPQHRLMLRQIIREQAWRLAPSRVGGFLSMAVWVRSRLAFSGLAYQLGRMTTGGPSLGRMVRAGWLAAKAAWQGILPMQTLLQGFTPVQERQLMEIVRDAERVLQDMGLDQMLQRESQSALQKTAQQPQDEHQIEQAYWAGKILHLLRSQGIPGFAESTATNRSRALFQERLEQAVTGSAAEIVFTRLGWLHTVIGNLLPTLVFGHAAHRLVFGWMEGAWLPFDFYLTAISVFLISLVPGYFLVAVSLARKVRTPDADALIEAVQSPTETADLRQVRHYLEELLQYTHALQDVLQISTDVLRQELDPSRFGTTVR